MKRTIIRNWLLLSIVLFSCQLFAQSTEAFRRTDAVYLKNGSIFRGQITAYEIGGDLTLQIAADRVMLIDAKSIKKVIQEPTEAEKRTQPEIATTEKVYAFRESGLHFSTTLGYIGGNDQFGNYTDGFNAHFQSIYQFNRFIGTGLGVGVDFYNVNLGSIVPIYTSVRGYLKAKNVSPYYQLAAGYGIPIVDDETSGFTKSKGGYYLAPEVGFRFAGSADANFFMGLGLQWQKASYTLDFNDTISNNKDEYTFRRFNFKIGILF